MKIMQKLEDAFLFLFCFFFNHIQDENENGQENVEKTGTKMSQGKIILKKRLRKGN